MAVEPLIMPKLGVYTDDVLLAEWLVEEGEQVAAGTAVFELETEKATANVEAESAGFVHRLVAAGESVPIGSTVAVIAETREEYERAAGDAEHKEPLVSPRARVLLQRLGYTLDDARGITPSGPGGRIVDRDVEVWAVGRAPSPAAATASERSSALTVRETLPLRGRRGTIARRMVSSLQTAAQLTSVLELDVQPLVDLRAKSRVGVTAIFVKLCAAALRDHPLLNARVSESTVEVLEEINVAVAIEADGGLVAPVVYGADRLSLEQID